MSLFTFKKITVSLITEVPVLPKLQMWLWSQLGSLVWQSFALYAPNLLQPSSRILVAIDKFSSSFIYWNIIHPVHYISYNKCNHSCSYVALSINPMKKTKLTTMYSSYKYCVCPKPQLSKIVHIWGNNWYANIDDLCKFLNLKISVYDSLCQSDLSMSPSVQTGINELSANINTRKLRSYVECIKPVK